jgi:hypothetical protein
VQRCNIPATRSFGAGTAGVPDYNSCGLCAKKESSARILTVTRERIERFFKNLASALGHRIFEDADVLGMVVPAVVCVGIPWLIGVAV